MADNPKCPFCEDSVQSQMAARRDASVFDCETCGLFEVSRPEMFNLRQKRLTPANRLNCVATNISDSALGLVPLWVSAKAGPAEDKNIIIREIDEFKDVPIQHAEKPIELLKLIALKLKNLGPFDSIALTRRDVYSLRIDGLEEFIVWAELLFDGGLITSNQISTSRRVMTGQIESIPKVDLSLTPAGWSKVTELFQNIHSRKVFIAMAFGSSERPAIQSAIEKGCQLAGWDAFTIDKKEYIGGISDEIIASINQSRFVVAEFTGNNHGVYYEAGYAAGKNLPVILLIKKDQIATVHFDTRHINHITWDTPEDLVLKLKNRIVAVIPDSRPS